MRQKINKHYVSDIDQFLGELRQEIAESDSQRQERKKYERITLLRDQAVQKDDNSEIWEDF